jgi:hypothetical protein
VAEFMEMGPLYEETSPRSASVEIAMKDFFGIYLINYYKS